MKGFIFLIGLLSVSIKNIVEDYVFSLRVLHVCLCPTVFMCGRLYFL